MFETTPVEDLAILGQERERIRILIQQHLDEKTFPFELVTDPFLDTSMLKSTAEGMGLHVRGLRGEHSRLTVCSSVKDRRKPKNRKINVNGVECDSIEELHTHGKVSTLTDISYEDGAKLRMRSISWAISFPKTKS